MKKNLLIVPALIFTAVICMYFVDISKTQTVNSDGQDTIVYGVTDISNDLEKVTDLSYSDTDVICATCRGLVEKDKDNNIIPSLAESFNVSSDGIQYEFKIKDDACWSDGSQITAEDIVTFFKQLLKEEDSENIKALLNVYGAKSYKDGKVTFAKNVAITSSDDKVIIRLNNKDNSFLSELTKPQYRIRKYLVMWNNIRNNYGDLIYSGSYSIKDVGDSYITLISNDRDAKNENIQMVKDESTESSMAAYEVNTRDIVLDPPESELDKLYKNNELITIPENVGYYMMMNNNGKIPMQGRRIIYNSIYKSIEEYSDKNSKAFDPAENCYFRKDKENLNKIQLRKVASNKTGEWSEPEVITIIGKDNKENRSLCRIIKDWFDANTNLTIKYSLVDDEQFDSEIRKKYDIVLIESEIDESDREKLYTNLEEYMNDTDENILESNRINDYYGDYTNLEESLFNNYNIVPICFKNKNIALSQKAVSTEVDGNGNINFDDK